jgi:hypothetical protein
MNEQQPLLLSLVEAAHLLGISVRTFVGLWPAAS